MFLHYLRQCFCTNSSSAHSLIRLSDNSKVNLTDDYEPNEFGWEDFVLASGDSKRDYITATIISNLHSSSSDSAELAIIKAKRDYFRQDVMSGKYENYVDHQSLINLPRIHNIYEKRLNLEFIQDLEDYLSNPKIIILGGNDNSDDHPLIKSLDGEIIQLLTPITDMHQDLVARKDGDIWVLFNKENGTKIRMSFKNDAVAIKPLAPELVDLAITDMCTSNCSFCYRSSIHNGKHANLKIIKKIIEELANLHVFEIAIGGGEPTLHPCFVKIVKMIHDHDMVPNFSTRNLKFFASEECQEVLKYCGAIAYSITPVDCQVGDHIYKELEILYGYCKTKQIPLSKIHIHLIMGIVEDHTFKYLITRIWQLGFQVTLLGYKPYGRADQNKLQIYSYDNWFQILLNIREENQSLRSERVSIDTLLAKQSEKFFQENDIPSWMYEVEEGKFSCFIDAVQNKIAPSSFADTKDQLPLVEENIFQLWETDHPHGERYKLTPKQITDSFALF